MTKQDSLDVAEMLEHVFQLIHTKCEIATLVAKNQNAPKYLYEQASDQQEHILFLARKLAD
ncbi:hypothetical protein [Pseudomonas laurylsulfatiphila]|uniref:hypothetical protein n=1 Tax=Pseudomonas laurylsulfatiphila TaxID=2011015 RepID=UPI003D230A80